MTAPRLVLAALALLAAAVVSAAALAVVDARRPEPRVAAAVALDPVPSRIEALEVLTDWDRRRSEAWAAGDPAALAVLYAPGSRAGRRDVGMLRRWSARGLRVTGLRMQVLDVRVHDGGGTRWDVDVTDRLAGGEVVGRRTTRALPRDGWSTRRVVLERVDGAWCVASVSRARP